MTPAGEVFLDWIQLPAMQCNGVKFESLSTVRRLFALTVPVRAVLRRYMHRAAILVAGFKSLTSTARVFERQDWPGDEAIVEPLTFDLSGHDKR